MSNRRQSRGTCTFCDQEFASGGIAPHLKSCAERAQALTNMEPGSGKEGVFYHLQIQDAWDRAYWLHLEVDGSAKLDDLDYYLRSIWLECCGHLSEFSTGSRRGTRIPMSRTIHQVFAKGVEVVHVYDFGTESVTKIKGVGTRQGIRIAKRAITLMARNLRPIIPCQECERDATHLCQECRIEEDRPGVLCEEHAESHPHDDYGPPIRMVNSPRIGLCGYDGPADPPY